jgi:hypothetical protein
VLGSLIAIMWLAPVVAMPLGHQATLQWARSDGANACIGDRELADAVTARLGGAPDATGAIRLQIEGEIAPMPAGGWHATIATRDDHGVQLGERELREASTDCHAIDDKLVLVIALIVDPSLLDSPSVPPPPPIARPVVPPVATVTRALAPGRSEPWHFGGGVAGVASRGMVPGFGFGTLIAMSFEAPHVWPIELAAVLWPYDRGYEGSGGATFLQATGGAALCPPLSHWASVCVGAQAGRIRANGFGFSQNASQTDSLVDATAELRLERSVSSSISVRLGVAAWVPFSRPRFVVGQLGAGDVGVYQAAIAAVVTQIAVWAHF